MTAIEAANEPPLERWPHFITKFQVLLAAEMPDEAAAFLEGLIHLFDGAIRQRTQVCILAAHAFAAKWDGAADYTERLRTFMAQLRASSWSAVLIKLPDHLAELCADALELDIEQDFCTALIRRRALVPPESSPSRWPWPLRVLVLGDFRMELNGVPVNAGAKPPTRSLDILRVLAISKDHACSLQDIYEWLWPDADGDQAKAACEQALHRLRKLLSAPDLIVQREGRLYLSAQHTWVDLIDWERKLALALRSSQDAVMREALDAFGGPLFHSERTTAWALPAIERVRSKFIDLVGRLARGAEARGDRAVARAVYLRAIDMYPTSAVCYEGLIRNRLAMNDQAGALEDYERYLRVIQSTREATPSPAIRSMVGGLLR
jgi:LuxR family maltose regulon positive regulatory protein